MKSKEEVENELQLTKQRIIKIEQETYDDTPHDKLIGTMEFNNMKLKSLRSVHDTLEWILSDTNQDMSTWGREKYNIGKRKHK